MKDIFNRTLKCLNTFKEIYPVESNENLKYLNLIVERTWDTQQRKENVYLDYELGCPEYDDKTESIVEEQRINHKVCIDEIVILNKYIDSYSRKYDLKRIADDVFKNVEWLAKHTNLLKEQYSVGDKYLPNGDACYLTSILDRYHMIVSREALKAGARIFWNNDSFYFFVPASWLNNINHYKNNSFYITIEWQYCRQRYTFYIFWSFSLSNKLVEFIPDAHRLDTIIPCTLSDDVDMERIPHHLKVIIYDKDVLIERNAILLPEVTSKIKELITQRAKCDEPDDCSDDLISVEGESHQWDWSISFGCDRYDARNGMDGSMDIEIDENDIARLKKFHGAIRNVEDYEEEL